MDTILLCGGDLREGEGGDVSDGHYPAMWWGFERRGGRRGGGEGGERGRRKGVRRGEGGEGKRGGEGGEGRGGKGEGERGGEEEGKGQEPKRTLNYA